MTAAIYRNMMRQLIPAMQDPDKLQKRIDELFPGATIEIIINRQSGEPLIRGLMPDQITVLLQDRLEHVSAV